MGLILKHFVLAILLLVAGMEFAHAEWIGNVSGQYEFNSNLSNAQRSGDIKSDSAFRMNLSGGKYFQLTDSTGLSMTVDLGGTNQVRFNGLNNLSYGLSTSLRHKFGLGDSAPWISVAGSAAYHDFENAPRDGWQYNLSFAMGKRLSEIWEIQVKYLYDERISDRVFNIPFLTTLSPPIFGDAFNISGHSVSLTNIFTITDKLYAYLGYTHREGGVTSSTRRNLNIFAASDAITPDNVYGNDFFAYRIDARSNKFSLGLSWALNGHASLNLGYDWMKTTGNHNLVYTNNLAHCSLIYRFE
jgi:hypothetical protein